MGTAPRTVSETDCLTLNIWTPDVVGAFPVLFWLHGGAWASGSGGWPWYDGARLAAEQGIVVVTVNYRLGPLGYLYLGGLEPALGNGNFGFADQAAALEWVASEIGGFGGDPAEITVGGQSAGAHSACLLACAEQTRPVVRRLLLQSGPFGWPLQTPEDAGNVAIGVLEALDIDPAKPDRLRIAGAGDLLAAAGLQARSRHTFASVSPPLQPTATAELPWSSPLDALAAGARSDLDVLVGVTGQEMRAFFDLDPSVANADQHQVLAELDRQFGNAVQIYNAYAADETDASPGQILGRVLGDAQFGLAALDVADHRHNRGTPAFVYQFDWRTGPFGACHCIDLPFLFGTRQAWMDAPMLTGVDSEFEPIHRAFSDGVGRFVRVGNPGWPSFDLADPIAMRFGAASDGVVESRHDLVALRDLLGTNH